jgi:hypothetical protein
VVTVPVIAAGGALLLVPPPQLAKRPDIMAKANLTAISWNEGRRSLIKILPIEPQISHGRKNLAKQA